VRLFYEGIVANLKWGVRILWRNIERRGPPVCLAALGLWAGLGLGGGGTLQLGFAVVFGAFAVSWMELCAAAAKRGRILLGALCAGCALSAGVLRFQTQQEAVPDAVASADVRGLHIDAFEGRLDIDSQTTARKNRKLELKVRALEFVGLNFRVRCEWKRPAFSQFLLSGAGPRLSAGTMIRAESVRGGDFFWVDARDIKRLEDARFFARFRAVLARHFAQGISAAAGKAGPLAQALLLGVKDELDTEFKGLFQEAGCAHLLALSGQHLSIICALVSLVGRRVARKEKRVRRVSLGFAWFFVWLAGPGPSLLRAIFMLSIAEIGKALDRPQSSFALLSCAAVLLALLAPSSINSLSSIYSFSAMAGLMLFAHRFSGFLKPYLPNSIAQALSASLAAICGTAMVSVLTFGTLIPASVLSATAAAPVMLAFMWIALSGGLLAGFFPVIGHITAPALELLQTVLTSILAFGASLPAIHLESDMAGRIAACILIALIIALIYAVPWLQWRNSRRTMEMLDSKNPSLRARGKILLFELQEE
jgi:ComEC/Rec2-related protein